MASAPQIRLNDAVSRSKCGWLLVAHQSHWGSSLAVQPVPQQFVYAGGALPTHGQPGAMSGAFTYGPHSCFAEPLQVQ